LPIINKIRGAGINTEIYPDNSKIKKQLNYANSNSIPYVALVGESELLDGTITLKDMETGNQEKLKIHNLIDRVS